MYRRALYEVEGGKAKSAPPPWSEDAMAEGSESGDGCGCTGDPVRAEKDPAYRRALWIVVILNLGFGAIEIVGGFIANSQALKADSLDFIGDGTITLACLVAIGWTALARTRIALAQGLFLLTLGLGVIGVALWRALTAVPPEAELMGGIGFVALLVHLTSAAVLSRFREGDANVRAVWLFSRNDAVANVAVIIAAGLVAWTGQAWPDLAVAAIIAALFLHSAYEILRSARTELRELSTVTGQ
jgi:cation diffusion facilitator family transporter